jgi:hypothetical protein
MILNGQDLVIVTGAIWTYLDGPLHADVRRSISEDDRRALDDLSERVHEATDAEWKRAGTEGAPTRREVIERRLAISIEWAFTEHEAKLLAQVLEACAYDLDHEGDVQFLVNVGEYGIRAEHLRDLGRRLIPGNPTARQEHQ